MLIHRTSGEEYPVEITAVLMNDLKNIHSDNGWNSFDWSHYVSNKKYKVMKLSVSGDDSIQGLICLEKRDGWVEVHLAESAPWNIGTEKQEFIGVGVHLFAIACKLSFDFGYDGYVAFHAKSNLVKHYEKTLKAYIIDYKSRRMIIDTKGAEILVHTFLVKGDQWYE